MLKEAPELNALDASAVAKVQNEIKTIKDNLENSSKIVDENGEPLVVYHQTNSKRYINKYTGEDWDKLDWKAKAEWDNRTDEEWNDTWEEQDFINAKNNYN